MRPGLSTGFVENVESINRKTSQLVDAPRTEVRRAREVDGRSIRYGASKGGIRVVTAIEWIVSELKEDKDIMKEAWHKFTMGVPVSRGGLLIRKEMKGPQSKTCPRPD